MSEPGGRVLAGHQDGRTQKLNGLLCDLSPGAAAELLSSVAAEAMDGGLWTEVHGVRHSIPFTVRPRLLDLACRGYLHHVAWQVRLGLRRLPRLLFEVPDVAGLLPLEPGEHEWVERYRREGRAGPGERVFCRLDALASFDGPDWRDTLKLLETNVVGAGGLTYAPAVESALLTGLEKHLPLEEQELFLEPNQDPRLLLLDELLEQARLLGVSGPPTIGLVDDRDLYRLGGEMGRLEYFFKRRGASVVWLDPRELEVGPRRQLGARGQRVDLLYRFLELREFAQMETRGADLAGLKLAFQEGRVIPSVAGDMEHKSAFEVLTSEAVEGGFTAEQREVYRKHVLWTRLLFGRRTTGIQGESVDLAPYVISRRERLVLKPNRSYGGEGVLIGPTVSQRQWEQAVDEALKAPATRVVQELAPPVRELFPFLDPDSGFRLETRYVSSGFFPARKGLGVFGRYCDGPVVNLSQNGGVAPSLVCVA